MVQATEWLRAIVAAFVCAMAPRLIEQELDLAYEAEAGKTLMRPDAFLCNVGGPREHRLRGLRCNAY